jgi:integrase
MAIYKVGKYYWLDIYVGKKRVRRSLKTGNKFEALDEYKKVKDKLLAEHRGGDVKFADFAEKYLDWAGSSQPASADREEQRLKKIEKFFEVLGILFLSDITPYHIEQLKAHLLEKGRMIKAPDGLKKEAGLDKATVNRYLQLLRGMFYRAIDWEVYSKPNPVKKVKFFREEREKRALSHDELQKILEAVRAIAAKARSPLQKVFPDLILFAAHTRLRKSEILNLRWKDVREDEISVLGKASRRRTVPLNKTARAILDRQVKRGESIFDIPNRDRKDLFRRTVAHIQKRTGIDFGFHDLRHYFTTALIEKGVDLITISAILGHSRTMTSLIYSHTDKTKMIKAVNFLS